MASLYTQIPPIPELGWPWTNFEALSTLAEAKATAATAATAQYLPQQDQKTCQEGHVHGQHPRNTISTLILIELIIQKNQIATVRTKKWVPAVYAANLSANDVT